jgi:hypothetical protein
MSQQESRIGEAGLAERMNVDAPLCELEATRQWSARSRTAEDTSAAIARQLNGPLTALLLYMGEIKQHSRQLSQSSDDRAYLQKIVENALQQTERVCALVKQIGAGDEPVMISRRAPGVKSSSVRDGQAKWVARRAFCRPQRSASVP